MLKREMDPPAQPASRYVVAGKRRMQIVYHKTVTHIRMFLAKQAFVCKSL